MCVFGDGECVPKSSFKRRGNKSSMVEHHAKGAQPIYVTLTFWASVFLRIVPFSFFSKRDSGLT